MSAQATLEGTAQGSDPAAPSKRIRPVGTPWLPPGSRKWLLAPGVLWMAIFLIVPMIMIVRASFYYNLSPTAQPECPLNLAEGESKPVLIVARDAECAFSWSLATEDWRRFFIAERDPPSERDMVNLVREILGALAAEQGLEISRSDRGDMAGRILAQIAPQAQDPVDVSAFEGDMISSFSSLSLRDLFRVEDGAAAVRTLPAQGNTLPAASAVAITALDAQRASLEGVDPATPDGLAAFEGAAETVLRLTLDAANPGEPTLIDKATATAFLQSLWRTLKLWAIVLVATIVVGYPIGLFIGLFVTNKITQTALLVACVIPFWTSFLIRVIAMRPILGIEGVINQTLMGMGLISEPIEALFGSELSIVIVLTQIYVVFMAGPVAFMIARIDRALIEAARDLGASTWQVFTRVVLPLSVPGVVVGAIFVSVMVLGDYAVAAAFGAKKVSILGLNISGQVSNNEWVMAAVCGVLLTLLTTIIIGGLLRMVSLRKEL